MIKREVKRIHVSGFLEAVIINRYYLICLAFLILGLLFGSVSIGRLGKKHLLFIEEGFKSYISFRTNSGFTSVFFSIFLSSLFCIACITISSFGIGGIPIIPIICFVRGFGNSIISGFLYREFSLQGVAFANLILLPASLATDFIILYISSEGLNLSFGFIGVLRDISSRGMLLRPALISLLRKTLRCLLIIVVTSLIETIFSMSFIKFFTFL